MITRTINISLLEQVPQERTLRFRPVLSSLDEDLLLETEYICTTDVNGVGSIDLPVKESGSVRYDFEFPKTGGKTTGYFYLTPGNPIGGDIDLSDLIAAGGEVSDSVIDYIDQRLEDAGIDGIAAVVDDTSPQLGGDLDLNGFQVLGQIESDQFILDGGLL